MPNKPDNEKLINTKNSSNKLNPNDGSSLIDNDIPKQIESLRSEAQKVREDFLIMFGLLAAVIAFLTAEVQAFKTLTSFASLVGFSSFLLSAILSFVVGLQVVVRSDEPLKRYLPTLILIVVFLLAAFSAFYWGEYHHFLFLK